jgi:hypothetical protein
VTAGDGGGALRHDDLGGQDGSDGNGIVVESVEGDKTVLDESGHVLVLDKATDDLDSTCLARQSDRTRVDLHCGANISCISWFVCTGLHGL